MTKIELDWIYIEFGKINLYKLMVKCSCITVFPFLGGSGKTQSRYHYFSYGRFEIDSDQISIIFYIGWSRKATNKLSLFLIWEDKDRYK